MKNRFAIAVSACLLLAGVSRAAAQHSAAARSYSNAELISVDSERRVIMVKNPDGANAAYLMDDSLAGLSNVKPGDRVILNVRRGGGAQRVSTIARVAGTYALVVVPRTPSLARPSTFEAPSEVSRQAAFGRQVGQLSDDARAIDDLWSSFWNDCEVEPVAVGFGRVWFGLWDDRIRADYSTGQCRDLFNQIVAAGELIKQGMAAAEDEARKGLTAVDIRDIRRAYVMDWEGWRLPPPSRREP